MSRDPLKRIRVLVIEDDQGTATAYSAILSAEADMEVAGVLFKLEPLWRALSKVDADVVLLDYMLSGKSAIAELRRLHVEHPEVPVVVISGYGNRETIDELLAAGAQAFITKGLSTDVIVEAIREVAAGKRRIVKSMEREWGAQPSHDMGTTRGRRAQ